MTTRARRSSLVARRRRVRRRRARSQAPTRRADDDDEQRRSRPSARPTMCIDQEIADRLAIKRKRRGAVDRLFVKQGRHEITIGGGYYDERSALAARTSSAASYTYHMTDETAVEFARLVHARERRHHPRARGQARRRARPTPTRAMIFAESLLVWSPVYGKLRLGGTIVHFDLHADVGVGVIDSKTSRGAAGVVGFGIRLFMGQAVAFRIDARNRTFRQELLDERFLVNDSAITAGPLGVPAVPQLSAGDRRCSRSSRRMDRCCVPRRSRSPRRRPTHAEGTTPPNADRPKPSRAADTNGSAGRAAEPGGRAGGDAPHRRRRRRRRQRGRRPPATTTEPRRADEPDVDSLRQEYLSLRDELFKSRARANAVASQLYSTRDHDQASRGTRARYYGVAKAIDPARRRDRLRGHRRRDRDRRRRAVRRLRRAGPPPRDVPRRGDRQGRRLVHVVDRVAGRRQGGRAARTSSSRRRRTTAATSRTSGRASEHGSYGARHRRRGEDGRARGEADGERKK